ncbi:hypothetical protein GTZ99_09745 [Novosphingobium sp. FSY-8]|uniref:Cell division protein FtsL n=1 Tax=Novosphingobium ovatum TaxID=1908523 RepID=A0ABW9XE69_9SPHN|nr:hypothetical protein [Novosphingobium ovatum]NBC36839.1 hypothetical protein [Novosphingobium ovatum]
MNLTRDRMHTIGWGMALSMCFGVTMVLTFCVNAVKQQVRLADRQIVQLQRETTFLETEFEARASHERLQAYNATELGYEAPLAAQFIGDERQLAAVDMPRHEGGPTPIRVAAVDLSAGEARALPAMVSPLTGKVLGGDDDQGGGHADSTTRHKPLKPGDLGARLSRTADQSHGIAGRGTRE